MNIKQRLTGFWINFRYVFRTKKPLLFIRLILTFLRIMLLGERPLRYVDLALDYRCNLKCNHCFATSLAKPGGESRKMGIKDYSRVAQECMRLGAVNFSFQGGEPLLLPELTDIISCFDPSRNIISVKTNGTLLTEENITKLKNAGVDILTVSLDSSIAEEHDRFRGVPGTYDKVVDGVNRAIKHGLGVTIVACVSHQNLHSKGVLNLIGMAKEMHAVLMFALAVPAGNWSENRDVLLTDEDMEFIFNLCRENPYVRTDFGANFVSWGCGAAKEILYLTPYGDVLPCPFIHISLGNIFDESVEKIRNRGLRYSHFEYYSSKCLAAQDRDFIKRYLSKTWGCRDLPISIEKFFGEN